jgi:hypothetical protein
MASQPVRRKDVEMRKVVVIFCLGLCAALLGCWLLLRPKVPTGPDGVSAALSKQIQRGPGTIVDFAEVAPFAWDRVFVFHPYTPHEVIHERLGFHWNGFERTTIEMSEGVNLVMFVRNKEVVHWFEHSRLELLEDLADPKGYTREQAKFQVRVGLAQRLALAPPGK